MATRPRHGRCRRDPLNVVSDFLCVLGDCLHLGADGDDLHQAYHAAFKVSEVYTLFSSVIGHRIRLGPLSLECECQTLTLAVALTLATCAQIDSDFGFNQSLFWDYVLPPIIFNAGYSMSQRRFFSNISTITLYGVTLPPRCPTPPPERL